LAESELNITLGEISRRFDRFEENIQQNFKAIDDRLANHLVSRDYYNIRHETLKEEIKELRQDLETIQVQRENDKNWKRNIYLGLTTSVIASLGFGSIIAATIHH
jgi:cell shape-determining protein MreC